MIPTRAPLLAPAERKFVNIGQLEDVAQIDARPSPFLVKIVGILHGRLSERGAVRHRAAPGVIRIDLQAAAKALHESCPEGIVLRAELVVATIQVTEVWQQPPWLNRPWSR